MQNVPTTDEMDHTTPAERNKLVGICGTCGEPTHFTRGLDKELCIRCGGTFLIGSIVSARTYNPTLHNRKRTSRRK